VTRGIVIPMAILSAVRPDWRLPERRARRRTLLRHFAQKAAFDWSDQLLSWRNFFLALDPTLKLYEKLALEAAAPARIARSKSRCWIT